MVEAINNNPAATWKASLTSSTASLTKSQIQKLLASKIPLDEPVGLVVTHEAEASSELPDSFDSRSNWENCESISMIRDQSDCGRKR